MALGKSKFGGNPHVPRNFRWYWFEGTSYLEEVPVYRPLSFLAQINLAEVARYDRDQLLPAEGILYFFYELGSMRWGDDPADRGCARVYYYNGKVDDLVVTAPTAEMRGEFILPEFDLSFGCEMSLPNREEFDSYYEEFCREYGISLVDSSGDKIQFDYDDEVAFYGCDPGEDYNRNKLLGYADCIQGPMLLECEEVSRGIPSGDSMKLTEEERKTFFRNSCEWILLFQMSSIEDDEIRGKFSLIFGGYGNIYFYIRKRDLVNRDFERV